MKLNLDEYFPLIDEAGNTVGKATRRECHNGSMLLHPVVHLHLINSRGEIYLQKRSPLKDIQPGKWDTAVGGHVDYNEPIESALLREANEELGIDGFEPHFLFRYIFQSNVEREMVHSYHTTYEGTITPDRDEITEGRYWSITEIETSLGKEIFTPNFEQEFALLKQHGLWQCD